MMEWKTMSKHEALIHLRRYSQMEGVPSSVYEKLNSDYRALRDRMCAVYASVEDRREHNGDRLPKDYATDLFCGLALHEFLNERGFGLWQAADDNVWRYIAVLTIPDIVHERLGGTFAKDAFSGVARSSRFWVRNIWWYIYLSLVESDGNIDYQATEEILSRNDTDILAGVVDHQGRGFRINLFRKMMRMFDAFCKSGKLTRSREDVFRYLIKEYQIRTAVIDPDLEGIEVFLKEIFGKGAFLRKVNV